MTLICEKCGEHGQMIGAGVFKCGCGTGPATDAEVKAMIDDLQTAFHEAQVYSLGVYYPDEDPTTYLRGWEYVARKILARKKP